MTHSDGKNPLPDTRTRARAIDHYTFHVSLPVTCVTAGQPRPHAEGKAVAQRKQTIPFAFLVEHYTEDGERRRSGRFGSAKIIGRIIGMTEDGQPRWALAITETTEQKNGATNTLAAGLVKHEPAASLMAQNRRCSPPSKDGLTVCAQTYPGRGRGYRYRYRRENVNHTRSWTIMPAAPVHSARDQQQLGQRA